MRSFCLSSLPFTFPGILVTEVIATPQQVVVHATSQVTQAVCPTCQEISSRIHSSYTRSPADLPSSGRKVLLVLRVRRFRCRNSECQQQTFVERLAALPVSARQTSRVGSILENLSIVLSGEAGARLALQLGIAVSADSLLRRVKKPLLHQIPPPKVLGVDDFAFRRGHTYGTILMDLTTHQPVDLFPDREAETLATWLRTHPGVQIVSRDRGGSYAEGVRKGAPGAIQVADRWHLLKNLGEAVQKLLIRHLLAFRRKKADPVSHSARQTQKPSTPIKQPIIVTPALTAIGEAREAERLARYEQVIAERVQGMSHQAIADHLGMGHATVQRWLQEEQFPQRKAREQRSQLDPFFPYIQLRQAQGCSNMVQLHHELRERGYQGSYEGMRHILLRMFPKEQKWQRAVPTKKEDPLVSLSSREAMWLFLRQPDQLTQREQPLVEHLCQIHEEVAVAYQFVQQFAFMVRNRTGGQLDTWLEAVAQSTLKDLHPFVKSIRLDIEAVEAGLILPWSNGPVEGKINTLKSIKRSMYGRSAFPLLRQKVLKAS